MRKFKIWKKAVAVTLATALVLGGVQLPGVGQTVAQAEGNNLLKDGDFEAASDLWDEGSVWKPEGSEEGDTFAKKSESAFGGSGKGVNVYSQSKREFTLTQNVNLKAGTYKLTAQSMGGDGENVDVLFNGVKGTVSQKNSGYGNWTESSGTFNLEADTNDVSVGVSISVEAGGWAHIDNVVLTKIDSSEVTEDKTTLYYYYEGTETLYMDVWNHAGITFASTAVTSAAFGWTNPQAELQKVEGYDKWYSVDYVIKSTSDNGFDIYEGNKDTKLAAYDNQWNNSSDYTTLVGGSSKEYAIKNGKLYISFAEAAKALTKQDLSALLATIPQNYQDMGFVQEGVDAVKTASAAATVVINDNAATDADIESAYKELAEAIDKLNFSAELFVKKVKGYDTDSIRGMDVSSYISVMESFEKVRELKKAAGASEAEIAKIGFKDWDGNVLDEQGFFNFLAKEGVNYIRVKVWNDPVNSTNGKSYGGGHNDLATAVQIGKYATKAGMKLLIDFHLSDFWADPGKQKAPKAWADFTVEQKAAATAKYITDSLKTLVTDNGVNVAMVQVGNETNGAVCGVTGTVGADNKDNWDDICKIFKAGCDAVHSFSKDILAAVHFTNPQKSGLQAGYAKLLEDANVNYDVFATSYYPNSHGTMKNLTEVLTKIAKTYDKYVMVAETAWANTDLNGDGFGDDKYNKGSDVDYNVTVQGQAEEIRDVISAVNDIDVTLTNGKKAALGFFYWEPAWVSVQNLYNADGTKKDNYDELYEQNKAIWEECGSGWASSFSSEYDPDDAGMWYGGSSMDNQSVFDFDGNPIYSIKAYNPDYLKYGAKTTVVADGYRADDVIMHVGDTLDTMLPKVTVVYNDSSRVEEEADWDTADVSRVNNAAKKLSGIGSYVINGTLKTDKSFKVQTTVFVEGVNILEDSGFENGSASNWVVSGNGAAIKSGEDKKSGEYCIHFYSDSDFEFEVTTTATATKEGEYAAYIYMQGLSSAGTREGENLVLTATTSDGKEYVSEKVTLAGWLGWQKVIVDGIKVTKEMITAGKGQITVSVKAKLNAGAWGTMDDASLYLYKEASKPSGSIIGSISGGSSGSLSTPVSTATPTATPTVTPTVTPTATPQVTATPEATPVPTVEPEPTLAPTVEPEPTAVPVAKGDKIKDSKGVVYTVTKTTGNNAAVTYTKPKNKKVTSVTISDTVKVDGVKYKVTAIEANAFKGYTKLKAVTVGKNIKTIGKNAFKGCKALKKVTIKTTNLTAKNIGKDAFKGLNAKAVVSVPKAKVKTYKKIFKTKGLDGKKQKVKSIKK